MSDEGRIAVGVSGAGSNLRALATAAGRGELGGAIVLVFADRPCAALDWAAEQGIDTALVPDGEDATLAATLTAVGADVVVLAGYMRIVGPAVLGAFGGRILNTHPSLLPAFPGAHAVDDALAHGVAVTGCTVHLVDATLDGGPIVAQEAVGVLPGDDAGDAPRPDPDRRAPAAATGGGAAAGRRAVGRGGRPDRAARHGPRRHDPAEAAPGAPVRVGQDRARRVRRRAGRGAVRAGVDRRHGAAAARGRPAGDRRRRRDRLPRDARRPGQDPPPADPRRDPRPILARRPTAIALLEAAIAPFELVVVNLYPFSAAAERAGITRDELIEEIDIGGPSLVRAAAKNHAGVTVVTSPDRYEGVLAAIVGEGSVGDGLRAALAVDTFRHTAAYDARIAEVLPVRMAAAGVALPDEAGLPGSADPFPPSLTIALEKVDALRYGENPHQAAARYRRPGGGVDDGPFATGEPPLAGKALSYNNVLDASAAAAIGRALRGPACVIVKHTNPCGAAERGTLLEAWQAALAGDPVSAFGGVVALTRPVDEAVATALVAIFLEVVVAPDFDEAALAVLATKPNLRLVRDPALGAERSPAMPDPIGAIRTAGGAVLVGAPDTAPDDPATWTVATHRAPDRCRAGRPGLRLAAGPRCDLERDRPRPRRPADRDGIGPDRRASTLPAARSTRRWPTRARTSCAAPPARPTRSTRSPTPSRSASPPASPRSSSPAARSATRTSSPPSTRPAARCC